MIVGIKLGPVYTAPFVYFVFYKNGEENLRFCENVHTDLHRRRKFLKPLQYPIMPFTKPEQCERSKTYIFCSVFVIRQINVNAQKRMFSPPFLYKNGVM